MLCCDQFSSEKKNPHNWSSNSKALLTHFHVQNIYPFSFNFFLARSLSQTQTMVFTENVTISAAIILHLMHPFVDIAFSYLSRGSSFAKTNTIKKAHRMSPANCLTQFQFILFIDMDTQTGATFFNHLFHAMFASAENV